MVSRVLYRPFDTEDFDAIALILQQLWHNNSDNDEYNRLEAACDLALLPFVFDVFAGCRNRRPCTRHCACTRRTELRRHR